MNEERLYNLVGASIKKIRTNQRLTQVALAAKVSMERTSITNIESGKQKVTLFALYKICDALKVNLDDVLPKADELAEYEVESDDNGLRSVGGKTLGIIQSLKSKKS